MDQKIQASPAGCNQIKGVVKRYIVGHVHINQEIGPQRRGQWFDPFAKHLSLIGKRQFRPRRMHRLCDAPGDGMVVGDPHDQPAFTLH